MRSRIPGDDKQMVLARNRFLDSGSYAPVARALVDAAVEACNGVEKPVILDAGCGEGYYTALLKEGMPEASVCGFDISKPAVQACCRRSKNIGWLVASVSDIPLADQQVDVIISVFSRCDWQEFSRVLKPDGKVFVLAPGEQHLYALRQVIYEQVRPYPVDKLVRDLPESFNLLENQPVQGTMALGSPELVLDLLAMTPHYWHVKPAQKQKLAELKNLDCRFDMKLYTIAYTPAES